MRVLEGSRNLLNLGTISVILDALITSFELPSEDCVVNQPRSAKIDGEGDEGPLP